MTGGVGSNEPLIERVLIPELTRFRPPWSGRRSVIALASWVRSGWPARH